MKKTIKFVPIFFLLLFQFYGCGEDQIESKNMEQIYKEEGIPVRVSNVELGSFKIKNNYNTTLSGIKESNASAMIGGRIEKVKVKVGDYVTKDQVLFEFPADEPSAQYYQAKVAFENSENMYNRYQKLFEVGGISAQDLDNVKTQYEVNKANYENVSKLVKVLAPISGYVTKVNARETDDVRKETVLATISNLSKLKGSILISEEEILNVRLGSKAVAEWQGMKIEGKVTQVDMAMDPMTQAFSADVIFENKDNLIKPGVTVDVILTNSADEDMIVTERKNLVKRGDKHFIYVIENGTAKLREVLIGANSGLEVEIKSGLNPGDLLVTEGQINLEDNAKVKIIK